MRISFVRIHNYRSIKNLELKCRPVVVLLGENNAGKSNILSAIEYALSPSAKPDPDDLFAFPDDGDSSLRVELTFECLTDRERAQYGQLVNSDGTVCIRKCATWDSRGIVSVQYEGCVESPPAEWLRSDKAGDYTRREQAAATPLAPYLPATGRLSRQRILDAQQQYIRDHAADIQMERRWERLQIGGQRGNLLPDCYLVPAVRDLDDEAKIKSSTMFGKLFSRAVEEMATNDSRYRKVRTQLDSLVKSFNKNAESDDRPQSLTDLETMLREELADWRVEVAIEVSPPEINKIFELGTNLRINDGHDTVAQRKGHGLQRAVLLGFVKAWAKAARSAARSGESPVSESMIFAIEEPELFLHPQAQRSLAEALRQLAQVDGRQIFLCSHSAHFVNLDHYREIAMVFKASPQCGTQIRQCNEDLFEGSHTADRKRRFHMAYWVNPDRSEMFFAKKVVFVEGETEKSVLPYLARQLGCHSPNVSIVDCGSKHNLPLYVTIANAFSLNYFVVHDEDALPDPIPADWDAIKCTDRQRTFDLNDEVANMVQDPSHIRTLCPDFEGACGISRTQGRAKGKALAALEHFQALEPADIPPHLAELVKAVYSL